MKELIGTGVALITPFTSDFKVDVEGLKRVVQYQINNGIEYLVVLGTTGESATLNDEEKQLVINTVVKENAGKLPLVLGIGGNNTAAVVEEFKTTNLDAFVAVLSVSPMYNKPTQEGIYQHFSAIAKISSKPIILYNVPGRTSSNLEPRTVARLAHDFGNIVAIKEAKGDLVQAMDMIHQTPDDFHVISGDDMIALPMVLAGGSGVISVIGEGFPKQFSDMIRLGLQRDVDAAYKIHYDIAPCINYIFAEGNPAGIKSVFSAKEICEDTVRLPLVMVGEQLRKDIEAFVLSHS
ncbi:4-hydroxy-tetrahydrodipicolinate synthase [Patiriisocius marinistellae]|uniref:4-hydroxy-tetrahydrodipicolinate synthase n=1 Tax=Patiriisocius marinistellae TaxID=2494560 RepID=A0A5J4FVC1_9FLAO|nr:4-hydroxy-tetrahydrodipicolinate synthase [Patiriisocius marinistellae]GEQ86657.1 4-hydroxy-tetrahydrodipicolinate synthase [Patiriisocius marinistellae]